MTVLRRGNILYLRKRVPAQFAAVEKRAIVWLSLKTNFEAEAERKAPAVWEAMLDSWEAQLAASVTALAARLRQEDKPTLRAILSTGQIGNSAIKIALDPAALATAIGVLPEALRAEASSLIAPFALRRRGIETKIIAGTQVPAADPTLVRMLSKAHRWMLALQDGTALTEIARRDCHAESHVSTRIPLAFLSPRIQAAILDGTQPRDLSVEHILRIGIPLDWTEQERAFGFTSYTAPSLF